MRMGGIIVLVIAGMPATVGAQEQVVPAPISREDIATALRRYDREPDVGRVIRVALRVQATASARVRDAIDRARISGALPVARVAVRRGQAIDLSALGGDDPRTNLYTDDDLMVEGSLVFHLERFVFAPEETSLLRELRAIDDARTELVRTVATLYFERRRLQLERDLLGTADLARELRILELEALLDVFTDGAFTRIIGDS